MVQGQFLPAGRVVFIGPTWQPRMVGWWGISNTEKFFSRGKKMRKDHGFFGVDSFWSRFFGGVIASLNSQITKKLQKSLPTKIDSKNTSVWRDVLENFHQSYRGKKFTRYTYIYIYITYIYIYIMHIYKSYIYCYLSIYIYIDIHTPYEILVHGISYIY